MGVLLVFLCSPWGVKGRTDIITAFPENGPTVVRPQTRQSRCLKMKHIDVILTTLEDQLKADPRVYDIAVGI